MISNDRASQWGSTYQIDESTWYTWEHEWGTQVLNAKNQAAFGNAQAGAPFAVFNKATAVQQQTAWLFFKFITEPAQTAYWSQNAGYMPVRRSALKTLRWRRIISSIRIAWRRYGNWWPDLADLLDIGAVGGTLLHANGLPLGRFDPAWRQLEWWARRLNLRFMEIGSSGHALPPDLTTVAVEAGAPVVMAIHSLYPELLDTGGARLLLPETGRAYRLAELPDR